MSEDIKELFEAYEENKRYGDTNAILITTDNENETARIATDMHRGFFITTMLNQVSSIIKNINPKGQVAQDAVMFLIYRTGLEFSKEFADALPTYDKFPRYIPKGEATSFDETPSQIIARLSK